MKFILSLVLLLTLFGLPISIEADDSANDVASEDLIFRRSTLIVRDIEKSLDLYRDSIGMELIYDQIIERDGNEIRLIFLKTKDDYVGVLGLVDYEYNNPDADVKKKPIRKEGFTPQNTVLVFNTNDLDARWKKIINTAGIEVIQKPTYTEYPSYDGSSVIKVNVSKFYDPDGNLVELNQILNSIH